MTSEKNRMRWHAVLIHRATIWLFGAIPERFAGRMRGVLWRWLFIAEDGGVHRSGEILLADLRKYALLDQPSAFHADPLVMAYRAGRRDVVVRIFNYLRLDEETVINLMEVDDGE